MRLGGAAQVVRLGNQAIRVQVVAESDEVPLLLLNGMGASIEVWNPLAKAIGGHLIAFDAPGTGGSPPSRSAMTIGGYARLALELLDRLDVPRAHLLGFSFGGMVAQEIAHLAPPRIDRVVLASTSCGWGGVPGSPAAMLAILTPTRFYSREFFESVAPQYVGGTEGTDPAFVESQAVAREAHPPNPVGYAHQVWAASTWSSRPWLSRIDQPTLVLYGDADPLVPPANGALLADLLPNGRAHVVKGGGHLCLLERARSLGQVIRGFLDGPAVRPKAAARRRPPRT